MSKKLKEETINTSKEYISYVWDMFMTNYEIFDRSAKKVLEDVIQNPNKRNESVGTITGLILDGYRNPTNLEIPADALLRIYQFNYDRIQKSIHRKVQDIEDIDEL